MSIRLNTRERTVMSIILHAESPVTASQIIKIDGTMNMNIVQPAIRKLLNANLIEVHDIIMEKNIFSRTFKPTKQAESIVKEMFADEYKEFLQLAPSDALFIALVETEINKSNTTEEIARLKTILDSYEK